MAFGKGLDGATGVGEVTLARWRSWGLFPKGARTFHGRHKGTGAFLYPPIAAEIIRVLRALPRLDRGVDAAFWALWLGGYTIDIGKWAAHRLAATQKKADKIAASDTQRQIRIPKKINAPAGATMTAHRGNICPLCGQASPSPMTMRGCCQACASGHVTERHHIWWKDNSPAVVEIPTNWHAVFNARWSERCAVLKRPGADPLHRGAAAARTVGEAAAALAEFAKAHGWPAWVATLAATFAEGMSSLANWLLLIAGRLDAAFGPDWAAKLGVPPWSPPEAP